MYVVLFSLFEESFYIVCNLFFVFMYVHAFVCLTWPSWRVELSLSLYSCFLLFLSVTSRRRLSGCSRSQTGFDQESVRNTHTHRRNAFMSPYEVVWWASGSTTGSVTVKQGLWFPFERLNESACVKDRNHSCGENNTLKKIYFVIIIVCPHFSIQSIWKG